MSFSWAGASFALWNLREDGAEKSRFFLVGKAPRIPVPVLAVRDRWASLLSQLKPAVNGNNKIQGKDSLACGLLGELDGNIVHVPCEA